MLHGIENGNIGLSVPPFLAILLSRCARRDAIPSILADMRQEFSNARNKIWELIGALSSAPTIAKHVEINRELERAAELMNPRTQWPSLVPTRTFWKLCLSAASGAAVGLIGGHPAGGAITGAVGQAVAFGGDLDFRLIFRQGAFDLARRVNLG